MKTNSDTKTMTITLSAHEFWYLAKIFGPGLAYGVVDPTTGLSESEILKAESEAIESLSKAGVITFDGENQVKMDELLGAMIYSCIHSNDVLILKSREFEKERYFHFLPDWQMEFSRLDRDYQLTVLIDRDSIFPAVISKYDLKLPAQSKDISFSVFERDLESAVFLYESDKKENAIKLFEGRVVGEIGNIEVFLQGYIESKHNLQMKIIYSRNEGQLHECKYELLMVNDVQYWLTYATTPGDDPFPIIYFTSISEDDARNRFLRMLPK